jgi:hypothetical protein
MIAELVYLLLSILVWFTPLVGTKPVSLKASRRTGEQPGLAIWIPLIGWVAVSVKCSAADSWLPQRVVSAQWLGRFAFFSGAVSESRFLSWNQWNLQAFTCRFWRQSETRRQHSLTIGHELDELGRSDTDTSRTD